MRSLVPPIARRDGVRAADGLRSRRGGLAVAAPVASWRAARLCGAIVRKNSGVRGGRSGQHVPGDAELTTESDHEGTGAEPGYSEGIGAKVHQPRPEIHRR